MWPLATHFSPPFPQPKVRASLRIHTDTSAKNLFRSQLWLLSSPLPRSSSTSIAPTLTCSFFPSFTLQDSIFFFQPKFSISNFLSSIPICFIRSSWSMKIQNFLYTAQYHWHFQLPITEFCVPGPSGFTIWHNIAWYTWYDEALESVAGNDDQCLHGQLQWTTCKIECD